MLKRREILSVNKAILRVTIMPNVYGTEFKIKGSRDSK